MINFPKLKNHILYFIICSLLNILFTEEAYKKYIISIKIEDTLGKLYINSTNINQNDVKITALCEQWIPSIFSPTLLVDSMRDTSEMTSIDKNGCTACTPIISTTSQFKLIFYSYELFEKGNLLLAKETFSEYVKDCYLGLSSGCGNYTILYDNETNLNILQKNNQIDKKIFSFNKWILKDSSIDIDFYLGDEHENFISNDGIIGKCYTNQSEPFWSSSFKEMSFNNSRTQLINPKDNQFYKIYFSSEDHRIIFPLSFRKNFNEITKNSCESDNQIEISCKNLFNLDNYFPLKLIDDNMTITIEIDNKLRFTKASDNKFKTNIRFEDVDYFILPLIVFKQFHVQFNAEKNIISFYTTDKSILELKEKEKEDESKNEDKESDSNAGTVVLIIFIIIIIIALGIGIFWFIRKRKNESEKNINKYNKFEEDENNFQDMNEKRVF
jgi:hypothetical protein